ncbi:hypothetical protein [Kitasatospora albolonga]|uniref:hypothetical protein n=1 Tax=Kitasatospora albolonga TaxID=68173 RepID=UPI0035E81E2B
MEIGAAGGASESVTFSAWREDEPVPWAPSGRRYVTANELLVRLGSFGLGLIWRVRFYEEWLEGIAKLSEDGLGTLELLAELPADLQAVDADFVGYAGTERVLVLREFDSTSWELMTADPWLLTEIRRLFPDTAPLSLDGWEESPWWEEPLPEGWGGQVGRRSARRLRGAAAPLPPQSA